MPEDLKTAPKSFAPGLLTVVLFLGVGFVGFSLWGVIHGETTREKHQKACEEKGMKAFLAAPWDDVKNKKWVCIDEGLMVAPN